MNTAWVCSTMVLLVGINPLLDNYFSHLGKHHWQHNFQKRSLATCIFLSSTGWQILVNASQKIKGKTTGAQRTTNWSYYRNKYQTTIGKIFKFYTKPETPDYWHTHQQAWSRVFNHKSNKYWICACPAHLIWKYQDIAFKWQKLPRLWSTKLYSFLPAWLLYALATTERAISCNAAAVGIDSDIAYPERVWESYNLERAYGDFSLKIMFAYPRNCHSSSDVRILNS